MAARIRRIRHDEDTRAKIKTSQLINRLTDHIDGKVELSNTQIRGIEILLNRTLPVLSSVEHTGNQQTGLSELLALASKQAAALEASAKRSQKPSEAAREEIPAKVGNHQGNTDTSPGKQLN